MFNAIEWEIDILHVSQITWLSCQIFGISNQAVDFVRDEKILRPR